MDSIELTRCVWSGKDPLYLQYHDTEWGVPVHDDQYPICIDEHSGEFTFQVGIYTHSSTKKGEPFNPFHPKNIKGLSLGIDIFSKDGKSHFTFKSPMYPDTTLTLENMLDSLGRYRGREIPIINDLDRNGSYGVYIPLNNYTFGHNNTLRPIFISNDHAVIWDQYNRWIKLTEFRKKPWPDKIQYDIELDININMYILPRTYYGVLDAEFKGSFTIFK